MNGQLLETAHGRTGLLAPFFDVDGFADAACLPQFLRLAREVGASDSPL